MDGFECCRALKDDIATQHIPVVMVTALSEAEERLKGLEAGADDFLTKPVDLDTLSARTRSLVRLKRLLDEWRARGETARALGLTAERLAILPIAGARALVVDDWDLGAEAIQDALSAEGVVAGRARSEEEAIQLSNAIPFDLLVLSLSLSVDDPLRLASQFRAADATHDVPLLLVTEMDDMGRVLRGLDMGASDWVMRPVDPNELRVRARNQIRRKFYQDRLRADVGHALAMALTDPLTGLYNQRYLMRHLHGLLAAGPKTDLAALMIDVDHFKNINDTYGHEAGDRALRAIAETLREQTRVFDSLARYGGEEFVVIMPGITEESAVAAGERLRAAVADLVFEPTPGNRARLTVSVGIARSLGGEETAEALLRRADHALYDAKRGGRNRVSLAQ
jgi:two-component system cell cycle response regulator